MLAYRQTSGNFTRMSKKSQQIKGKKQPQSACQMIIDEG
jgi:hypothetical protein